MTSTTCLHPVSSLARLNEVFILASPVSTQQALDEETRVGDH